MAEDAFARVNLRSAEFEVKGSEAFVERMIDALVDLIGKPPIPVAPLPPLEEPGSPLSNGADGPNLGSFLAAKKISKQSTHGDIIVAFVYFHTKVKKNATCTGADLMTMYEDAGLPKPGNISRDLTNLTRTDGKGFLSSASRGKYKLTIPGDNYVLKLGSG